MGDGRGTIVCKDDKVLSISILASGNCQRGRQRKRVLLTLMKVGDRVRVKESVTLYNYPLHRRKAFDVKGLEGTVVKVMKDWQGRSISPTLPLVVEFSVEGAKRPFRAHFKGDELELIDG